MRRTVCFGSASLLLLILAIPATADDAALSSAEHQTLEAFGSSQPDCSEWSDGCAVCVRTGATDMRCSLPGIACQPSIILCRKPPVAAPR